MTNSSSPTPEELAHKLRAVADSSYLRCPWCGCKSAGTHAENCPIELVALMLEAVPSEKGEFVRPENWKPTAGDPGSPFAPTIFDDKKLPCATCPNPPSCAEYGGCQLRDDPPDNTRDKQEKGDPLATLLACINMTDGHLQEMLRYVYDQIDGYAETFEMQKVTIASLRADLSARGENASESLTSSRSK